MGSKHKLRSLATEVGLGYIRESLSIAAATYLGSAKPDSVRVARRAIESGLAAVAPLRVQGFLGPHFAIHARRGHLVVTGRPAFNAHLAYGSDPLAGRVLGKPGGRGGRVG